MIQTSESDFTGELIILFCSDMNLAVDYTITVYLLTFFIIWTQTHSELVNWCFGDTLHSSGHFMAFMYEKVDWLICQIKVGCSA